MPTFLIFAVCAFASGFALRLTDPIVLPIAHHFGVAATAAALLNTAYALPYALAQPFLGPLGDRFGKARCIQVCVAALAAMLALGAVAPSFALLLATRVVAGICAGGLIPLVLASIGDRYGMHERQVMIGRMLLAIISGQMLGSVVSGIANEAFGWRSPLFVAAGVAVVAAGFAWLAIPASAHQRPAGHTPGASFRALYGRVFENPKAVWLYGAVLVEGLLFFGLFPYVGSLLLEHAGPGGAVLSSQTGFVLGAFGIGGLAYAIAVPLLIRTFGVARMCLIGAIGAGLCYAALAFLPLWWLAALAMLIAGFCYYMLHNSMQTEATELAPSARGSAVALFACGFFTGQALGPLLFGPLMHTVGFAATLIGTGVALALLGVVFVRSVVAGRERVEPLAAEG
ncbi:MFS transporter [Piscinibacter koreensis]|uniref:MFS transporter n=1 Tax=Piscinibacter koreensis TaxID=2742824 RepID=A0A7Y6TV37_9BURK|nr:MFS transporter [Schlegelella koreensis]NUZ04684.1 MFS transporter [Schlegelella koreensis]